MIYFSYGKVTKFEITKFEADGDKVRNDKVQNYFRAIGHQNIALALCN